MRLLLRHVALHVVLLLILCMVSESTYVRDENSEGRPYWPNPETAERAFWDRIAEKNLKSKLEYYKPMLKAKPPKNVILFIGDGMGMTSVTIARRFKNQLDSKSINLNAPLSFEKFRHSGLSRTSSFDFHVTDSAAGAMALLSGWKVKQNILGTKPSFKATCKDGDGAIRDTIADLAVEKGISVGLVTTDSVTGATPGAMYAKLINRKYERPKREESDCPDIAKQMVSDTGIASKFRLIMGGGEVHFFPTNNETLRRQMMSDKREVSKEADKACERSKEEGGCRIDGENLVDKWYEYGDKRRNHFIQNKTQLDTLNYKAGDRVLGLFDKKTMQLSMAARGSLRSPEKERDDSPTLTEMSTKAVELMEKENPKGYFLLIEGAQIDKALHGNLAAMSTFELLEFENAIEKVRNMTNPEETLILVTADHSHSIAMPGYAEQGMNVLQSFNTDEVRLAGMHFATGPNRDDGVKEITKEILEHPYFPYPRHIKTSTARHGGEDVGIWADGPYSWLFSGSLENTEVAYYMKCLLNLIEDNPINSARGGSEESKGQNGNSKGRKGNRNVKS